MKFKNMISVITFGVFLFSMCAICTLKSDAEYSESERRALLQAPEFSLSSVTNGDFMKNFESYTSDQFPFRDSFRSVKSLFARFALGKLENNGLFIAEGHLSKIDEEENEAMLNHAANKFEYIYKSYLKDKNTNVYFTIVPDKNRFLASKNGYPSLDYKGFENSMKEKTPYMKYIDIASLLSIDDYYTTDTHWKQENITDIAQKIASEMGADVKSEYNINTLENPFYGVYHSQAALPFIKSDTIKYLTNDTIDGCIVTYYDTGMPKKGEMYNMKKAFGKDPYEMFLSGVAPLITIENPNAKKEKHLVMFRDSFGSSLAPLMAEGYSKITVIDIRYIQSGLLGSFVDFSDADVLFIYSTALLNNSLALN